MFLVITLYLFLLNISPSWRAAYMHFSLPVFFGLKRQKVKGACMGGAGGDFWYGRANSNTSMTLLCYIS